MEQGQKVAVATTGAVLPGDFKINKVTLRGIESNGMICSLQELGVDDKYVPTDVAEGIFVFPDDVQVRSEEHTSELQSRGHLVCRLLLEQKKPSLVYTCDSQ